VKLAIAAIITLIKLKAKFALSSSLATAVDYGLYQVLVDRVFPPVVTNVITASTGMLINFILQKKYIFDLNRTAKKAFMISIASSIVGIAISTGLIHIFTTNDFFGKNQRIIKAIVTGIMFFYNFYMKRFAFEKKMI